MDFIGPTKVRDIKMYTSVSQAGVSPRMQTSAVNLLISFRMTAENLLKDDSLRTFIIPIPGDVISLFVKLDDDSMSTFLYDVECQYFDEDYDVQVSSHTDFMKLRCFSNANDIVKYITEQSTIMSRDILVGFRDLDVIQSMYPGWSYLLGIFDHTKCASYLSPEIMPIYVLYDSFTITDEREPFDSYIYLPSKFNVRNSDKRKSCIFGCPIDDSGIDKAVKSAVLPSLMFGTKDEVGLSKPFISLNRGGIIPNNITVIRPDVYINADCFFNTRTGSIVFSRKHLEQDPKGGIIEI
jgi:hypothetical protein